MPEVHDPHRSVKEDFRRKLRDQRKIDEKRVLAVKFECSRLRKEFFAIRSSMQQLQKSCEDQAASLPKEFNEKV